LLVSANFSAENFFRVKKRLFLQQEIVFQEIIATDVMTSSTPLGFLLQSRSQAYQRNLIIKMID